MRALRSNALSLLALFVALGGTSYAIVALPKNSVTTRQVKDGSLLRRDFKASERRKLRGPRGATGATGPAGAAGAAGATGPAGPSEVLVKSLGSGSVSSNSAATIGASVSPGAGSYLVRARANLLGASGQSQVIRCRIDTAGTTGPVSEEFWLDQLGNPGESGAVWAERAVTLTAADPSVSFVCPRRSTAPSYTYDNAEMLLQRVEKVTTLP